MSRTAECRCPMSKGAFGPVLALSYVEIQEKRAAFSTILNSVLCSCNWVPGGLAIPTGGLLGMDRTVLKSDGTSTWLDSPSWDDSVDSSSGGFEPLDDEMGTGHLNASRALQQFAAAEHEEFGVAGGRVPTVGWDYGTTTGDGDINRYRFNQELEAGSFVAITLAWDRRVEFDTDGGTTGVFDSGDTFLEYVDRCGARTNERHDPLEGRKTT